MSRVLHDMALKLPAVQVPTPCQSTSRLNCCHSALKQPYLLLTVSQCDTRLCLTVLPFTLLAITLLAVTLLAITLMHGTLLRATLLLTFLQLQARGRARSARLDPVTPRNFNSSKLPGSLEWRSPPGAESSSSHLSAQLGQPNLLREGSTASTSSASAQPVATSSMVEVSVVCCLYATVRGASS